MDTGAAGDSYSDNIALQLRTTDNATIRTPMPYTLGTAAKATGKDRATISRAIKKGKISARKNEQGQWAIDPAELHRVYPALPSSDSARNSDDATENNTDLIIENKVMKAKLEALSQQVNSLQNDKEFLQTELNKATALLTDQREKSADEPLTLWQWLGLSKR